MTITMKPDTSQRSVQIHVWHYGHNMDPVTVTVQWLDRCYTATSSILCNLEFWLKKVITAFIVSVSSAWFCKPLASSQFHSSLSEFWFTTTDWPIWQTTWILEWRSISLRGWSVVRQPLCDRNESTITTKKKSPKCGKWPLRKMKMITHSQDE